MTIVNASEFVKTHIRWTWGPPDNADERSTAAEAVNALFTLTRGWLDIVALEVVLGIYDREKFTDESLSPTEPFHVLRVEPAPNVRVDPTYRAIESRTAIMSPETVGAWLDEKMSFIGIAEPRYEPCIRELLVAGSRARLPDAPVTTSLTVSCYAGEIAVPVDHGWVAAPMAPDGIPDPVTLRVTNLFGQLRLILEVFWSSWASDSEPVAPIRDGLSRLRARGWRLDD